MSSFVISQSVSDISFNMINFLNLAEQAEATTNQPKGRLPGLLQAKQALQQSDHATLQYVAGRICNNPARWMLSDDTVQFVTNLIQACPVQMGKKLLICFQKIWTDHQVISDKLVSKIIVAFVQRQIYATNKLVLQAVKKQPFLFLTSPLLYAILSCQQGQKDALEDLKQGLLSIFGQLSKSNFKKIQETTESYTAFSETIHLLTAQTSVASNANRGIARFLRNI